MSGEGKQGYGLLARLRPRPGEEQAIEAHVAAWHRTAGRSLPGTRLRLLFDAESGTGGMMLLHLFESAAAYERAAVHVEHQEWSRGLAALLAEPPLIEEVSVRWNAATGARPRVSVSIDRDVHATVQDLIGRLLDRHPRTAAEALYLTMLESIAAEYERDYPATVPEEGDPR